jgi:hypothetical protein
MADIAATGHRSALMARIYADYLRMAQECALVTATDDKHAPYLFNTIASIQARFPEHPLLHVFDLGMNRWQRRELAGVSRVRLRAVEHFAPHWKKNWSWKPYILTQVPQRYVFYFDASNIVLFRPLILWFRAIANRGYMLFDNGQKMFQTTPPDYWALFDCDPQRWSEAVTFGAGLMGLDRDGIAGTILDEVLERTRQGWTLGCSANETRLAYDRSVVRECECFRADQTLFNLAFRKHIGELVLRNERKYCGLSGPADAPRQYLWYARRQRRSLIYFWRPIGRLDLTFLFNRLLSYLRILAKDCAVWLLRLWSGRR